MAGHRAVLEAGGWEVGWGDKGEEEGGVGDGYWRFLFVFFYSFFVCSGLGCFHGVCLLKSNDYLMHIRRKSESVCVPLTRGICARPLIPISAFTLRR